jgi:hypothetical protein
MFFQVIMQGHKLVYEPASMLYHLHHRNYADLCKQIYYYGVNLTGQLTKNIFERPVLLLDLLSKVPYGLYFTLSGHSSKNRYKSVHYPKELTWLELKGMFYGPLAYLQSRRTLRHADQHSVASPSSFYHTMENSDHTFPYK